MSDAFEIVAGTADETEMTALLVASLAIAAGASAPPAPAPPGEWVLRGRGGGAATLPGARSRSWRWSLHP